MLVRIKYESHGVVAMTAVCLFESQQAVQRLETWQHTAIKNRIL